jgi:hypothetical protein
MNIFLNFQEVFFTVYAYYSLQNLDERRFGVRTFQLLPQQLGILLLTAFGVYEL